MNRREAQRLHRRVPVRFSPRGGGGSFKGYTRDISSGGLFLEAGRVFKSGSRLRLEVDPEHEEQSFFVEGVVAHSHRVDPALSAALKASGMGIRFLTGEELFASLLEGPGEAGTSSRPVSEEEIPSPDGVDDRSGGTRGANAQGVYPVELSPARFLEVHGTDLPHGGLFVPTDDPAPFGAEVLLELQVEGRTPLRLEARVVRVAPGGSAGSGDPAGMGVQLLRLEELRPLLDELARSLRGGR